MASANGKAIGQATDTLIAVWQEISALEREISHAVTERLQGQAITVADPSEESEYDESEAICVQYMWQHKASPKNAKKRFLTIAFDITMTCNDEYFPGMDEPCLHVAVADGEIFDIDDFVWQGDPADYAEGDIALKHNNKVHTWEGEYDYFSVSLAAVEDRGDVKKQIVEPAVALILARLGATEPSESEAIFATADKLLKFELYQSGVRATTD